MSKPLTYVILALTLAAVWVDMTFFTDPCEGNVYMQQMKEQKRLEQEQLKIPANKTVSGDDALATNSVIVWSLDIM